MIKSKTFLKDSGVIDFLTANSEKMVRSEDGSTATYDDAVTVETTATEIKLKLKGTDVGVNLHNGGSSFVLRFMENDNGFTLVTIISPTNSRIGTAIKTKDGYYLSDNSLLLFRGKDKTLKNITRLPYSRETMDGENKKIELINSKIFVENETLKNPVEVTKFLDCTTIAKHKLYEIDGRNYYSTTENMLMEV